MFQELDNASETCSLEHCKGFTFERFCDDWKNLVNEYEMCHRETKESSSETKENIEHEDTYDDGMST